MLKNKTDLRPKVKRRTPRQKLHVTGLVFLQWTAILFGTPSAPQAQAPSADWRTLETPHFRIHFPAEAEAWTRHVATRLESIRQRVGEEVGYDLEEPTDILVMDPVARPNGTAYPLLRRPRAVLWTTPPPPDSIIGHFDDWAELLAVHEDVHLVHLSRPSRHPLRTWVERLLPIGPVAAKAPRWVTEGYATLLEGQLTGYGRPNSDLRAAILRRKAQLGELPSYGQLDGDGRWFGRSMAYLMGSAFLDWLVEREGPDSLRHLWLRLSARQTRDFDGAFSGVFGDSPQRLYNRFCAEVTFNALLLERELGDDLRQGELWQDLSWSTGAPAISPDGEQLAVILRSSDDPPRLVLWSTAPNLEAEKSWDEKVASLKRRDPLDVPAVRRKPLRREPVFELPAHHGRRPDSARFSPDGKSLLFISFEPDRDGFLHPDLFRWTPEQGRIERLTRGADIREIDPAPDGRFAYGVRHRHGLSRLVKIELASGAALPLADTAPGTVFSQPRISPDGRDLAFVRNRGDGWSLIVRDLASGVEERLPTPADAFIAHPAWSADGQTLFASIGEQGQIDVRAFFPHTDRAPHPVTRTLGAALSPAPTPDGRGLFFLGLEADGFDLRRLELDDSDRLELRDPTSEPKLALEPVQPDRPKVAPLPLDVADLGASRPYGVGRLEWLPLLGGAYAPGGRSAMVGVRVGDIVGRSSLLAALSRGDGSFDGGSLALRWRGWPIEVWLHGWSGEERPSRQPSGSDPAGASLDLERRGVEAIASWTRQARRWGTRIDFGGAVERLDTANLTLDRQRIFVDVQQSSRHRWGDWALDQELDLDLQRGETEGESWRLEGGRLRLAGGFDDLRLGATWQRRSIDDARFGVDRLQLGGPDELLLPRSVERARLAVAALPRGSLIGDEYEFQRLDLRLGERPAWLFHERHRLWSTGDAKGEWLELRGLELRWRSAPIPLLRVPAIEFQAGVAEILDPPFEDEFEGWIQIGFRP